MLTHKQLTKTGFTLIELLIVTSLTVLLLLTITSMFMTFLLSNSKTNTKKTVKEEGLHAMSQMEFLLKNAFYIDEELTPCISGMTSIAIVSLDGGTTLLQTQTQDDSGIETIASNSAALTSDSVTLSNLRFDCSGTAGNRQVRVSFDLEKNAPTLGTEHAPITESFTATILLRN